MVYVDRQSIIIVITPFLIGIRSALKIFTNLRLMNAAKSFRQV